MSNPSLRKGTDGENAVCLYLSRWWPYVERRAKRGNKDAGDIAGIPGVMIEVKARPKKFNIAGWLREVAVQQENARADVGVCWFKLPGTTKAERWAVVMTGEMFARLMWEWQNPNKVFPVDGLDAEREATA